MELAVNNKLKSMKNEGKEQRSIAELSEILASVEESQQSKNAVERLSYDLVFVNCLAEAVHLDICLAD